MASFKLKFRPSAIEGREGTLFLQVTHNRTVRTVCTGCRINPGDWDGEASYIRNTEVPGRKERLRQVEAHIRWITRRLSGIVREKEMTMAEYTTDDIVSEYRRCTSGLTWIGFIRMHAERKTAEGRNGTAKTSRAALASFSHFRKGEDMLPDVLDGDEMARYEMWLRGRGVRRNSSSCYLRTLRTLYRKAVEQGLTADNDIFRHVFTGFAKTAKRAIAIDAVRNIKRLELPEDSTCAFARDMFILSFYLRGMPFIDMAYLCKSDIRNGLLQYNRKKTMQSLSVCWEPPMQDIVDKYSHLTKESPFLLPIITKFDGTERKQYERMEHKVNRHLKKIGEMAGLHIPLTTYVARHTWASAMRDMGCSLSVICSGLGHESLKTTQIYLSSIDTEDVTKANRKIIGKILNRK